MGIRTVSFIIVFGLILGMIIPLKEGQFVEQGTTAIILNSICNIVGNLDEISGKEQATPPNYIINVLDWHLERRNSY